MTLDRKSDAELIAAVRRGDSAAYGVLYERHLRAAQRAAACLSSTAAEREDLVADAFTRVLGVLRAGHGPDEEFRAYLLVTMRNAAISTSRGASVSLYADVPEPFLAEAANDPVLNSWDVAAAAAAFASLPERWRTVLWHTEVEDETPAAIAPLLGLRPNGVAALAYRAREGLRQAYLQAHLPTVEGRECRATVSKLPGWVRRSTPGPLGNKISKHLAACADCRDRADTLAKVNDELRACVAPLVLGVPLAAAYLAAPAKAAVVTKTLLAKVGAVLAIAATAATTVAAGPNFAADALGHGVPAVANPAVVSTSAIEGPVPSLVASMMPVVFPVLVQPPQDMVVPSTDVAVPPHKVPAPTGNGAANAAANAAERAATPLATVLRNGNPTMQETKEAKQAAKDAKKADKEAEKGAR